MHSILMSLSSAVGILEGIQIVGNLAAKDDFKPALESSKTIDLLFLILLKVEKTMKLFLAMMLNH